MPSSPTQSFTLEPYQAVRGMAVRKVSGEVTRTPEGLRVRYLLGGDSDRLRIPEARAPRFADELWRHTCFELFVTRKGEKGYQEFNFSPSGEWAVYDFASYRERVPLDPEMDISAMNPCIATRPLSGELELKAVVNVDRLCRAAGAKLVLGISAVIEDADGALTYWALKHPSTKPDFHHPDAFVMEFDEIRN